MVEFMEILKKTVEQNCKVVLCLDGLPKKGGVSAEIQSGYNQSLYYSKQAVIVLPVLFLSKSKDQRKCIHDLCQIGRYLQEQKTYPQGTGFDWLDAAISTYPGKVGIQEDGQWIYSMVMNMKLYI